MTAFFAALLEPFGADTFDAPARLLPLLCIVLLAALLGLARPLPAVAWPALREAAAAGARGFDPLRGIALCLRTAVLALLALAIAGPVVTARLRGAQGEGLDLVLALDVSGSMRAVDTEVRGEARTRLDLAREVVSRFAMHRVAAGDRVGLVVFGAQAYTQSPLTRDGRLLGSALARVSPGGSNEPTALGDGLALALRRVSPGGARATSEATPLAGRLIVLLTDGRGNAGSVPIDVAAGIAATKRIRVHTVGVGAERHEAPDRAAAAGQSLTDLDAATLRRVAAATGGRFFHARSTRDLDSVYAEIDALERIPRTLPDVIRAAPRPEPVLLCAGILLAAEILLARVFLRRIP